MNKKTFTIVELLVAIGLAMVVVSVISTIYVRISKFALDQSATVSAFTSGESALDLMNDDLSRLYLPTIYPGATNAGRMRYDMRAASLNTGVNAGNTINATSASTPGWPLFIFTATQSGNFYDSSSTASDYYNEIAYFCGPSLGNLPTTGLINDNLFTIYRKVYKKPVTTPGSSLFSSATILLNNTNILSAKVIYMACVFHQGETTTRAGSARASRNTLDTSLDTFANTENYCPDEMDIIYTVVPDSGYLEFKCTASPASTDTFESYQQFGTGGVTVASTLIEKLSAFSFDAEGFFANLTTGKLFYYRRSSLTAGNLVVWYVAGSAASSTISATDTLVTGITIKRRIRLK
jgi:type II secretory pathway pseudopilin PulG